MTTPRRYTFGPVPSRRLGLSLGIDVIPRKVCCYDCVYCEVGKTQRTTIARKQYYRSAEILSEIREVLSLGEAIDWIDRKSVV